MPFIEPLPCPNRKLTRPTELSQCGKRFASLEEAQAECLRDENATGVIYEPPSVEAHAARAPSSETQSAASCSTGQIPVAESDDLGQTASMLLAERESILSEQRAEFYRTKRAELDGSMVDLDDDEAEIRNLKEAKRLAKLAFPEDAQVIALRTALDRKRDLERQLVETDRELETFVNTLSKSAPSTGKRRKTT